MARACFPISSPTALTAKRIFPASTLKANIPALNANPAALNVANIFDRKSNAVFTAGMARKLFNAFNIPVSTVKNWVIAPDVAVNSTNLINDFINSARAGPPSFSSFNRFPKEGAAVFNILKNSPMFGSAPAFSSSLVNAPTADRTAFALTATSLKY